MVDRASGELGGGAVGCWDGAGGEEKSGAGGASCAVGRRSRLRPPPLFRGVSPTGASSGLPPHRRLRAAFRRSRAVLPLDTRPDPSEQRDGRPRLRPGPSRTRHGQRKAGEGPPSPAGRDDEPEGGAARTEERRVKKRMRRRRRTEGRRDKCPVNESGGLPARSAGAAGDGALCSWLESLGLADTPALAADRQGAGPGDPRRDRRPYFLPPIAQSRSLLDVPLLLPENSPPPSPRGSADAPSFPLPVPRLQPLPPTRK